MKYWGPDDICAHDVHEAEVMSARGWPATTGARLNADDSIRGFYEMEIIPNTVRKGTYFNVDTFEDKVDTIVDIELRHRKVNEATWTEDIFVAPLSQFDCPASQIGWADALSKAYDRAMQGV